MLNRVLLSLSYWNLSFLPAFWESQASKNRKQTFMRIKICIFLFSNLNLQHLLYHKNERKVILLRQNYKDSNATLEEGATKL